jgi:hypothetical protein
MRLAVVVVGSQARAALLTLGDEGNLLGRST